jgi:hypothetical protein
MDVKLLEVTLKTHITEMRQRLDQAAGIAKAAEACAETGKAPAASNSKPARPAAAAKPAAKRNTATPKQKPAPSTGKLAGKVQSAPGRHPSRTASWPCCSEPRVRRSPPS